MGNYGLSFCKMATAMLVNQLIDAPAGYRAHVEGTGGILSVEFEARTAHLSECHRDRSRTRATENSSASSQSNGGDHGVSMPIATGFGDMSMGHLAAFECLDDVHAGDALLADAHCCMFLQQNSGE
jgi:hypothetical protein